LVRHGESKISASTRARKYPEILTTPYILTITSKLGTEAREQKHAKSTNDTQGKLHVLTASKQKHVSPTKPCMRPHKAGG